MCRGGSQAVEAGAEGITVLFPLSVVLSLVLCLILPLCFSKNSNRIKRDSDSFFLKFNVSYVECNHVAFGA